MTGPDLLEDTYDHRVSVWSDIQGHMPYLRAAVTAYLKVRVLELGVRSGNSTAALLRGARDVEGHVWSIDITQPSVPHEWLDLPEWSLRVGDDRDPITIAWAPPEVDVLVIDTSHAYDHTLFELETYVPKVAVGGMVFLHDTLLEAPELVGPQPPYPVALAMTEFCAKHDLTCSNRDGSYGLGIISITKRVE